MTAPADKAAEEAVDTAEARVNGSDTFKLAVANAIRGVNPTGLTTQFISLHTTDPLTTGTPGELTDGVGGYARQPVTWGAAAMDGTQAKITGGQLTFNVPGSVAINFYGVWTAATGGTYLYGKALTPGATLSAAGTITITPTHAYGLL